jgi:hypothetical protein
MGKVFTSPKLKKRRFDPEKMSAEDIELPRVFKTIDNDRLRLLVKDEIDLFKTLDYKNKPDDQLKDPEYHSWQVGLLLKFIKEEMVYLYDAIDDILPSKTVYITKKNLHIKVFDIVYRYDNSVDKEFIKEELLQDIKWNAQEIAYLLKYITIEDRVLPRK